MGHIRSSNLQVETATLAGTFLIFIFASSFFCSTPSLPLLLHDHFVSLVTSSSTSRSPVAIWCVRIAFSPPPILLVHVVWIVSVSPTVVLQEFSWVVPKVVETENVSAIVVSLLASATN